MRYLITGAAGFIGMHVTQHLCARGDDVVGIDNFNDYYDISLKLQRVDHLKQSFPHLEIHKCDISDFSQLTTALGGQNFDGVIHLAAQAGVRYSIENPAAYAQSNLVGFTNILEYCRKGKVGHLVYASSSSVYGGNKKMPFSETDPVDHPVSFYAATKKANELMAHTYSHLYGLPTTGLRFFTVYGPWGRPDMAPFLFSDAILSGKPIKVFNYGNVSRDFTYIDDIVDGIIGTLDRPPTPDDGFDKLNPTPEKSWAPYRVFNIGNSAPSPVMDFIKLLEQAYGRTAIIDLQPIAPGDVEATFASTEALSLLTGCKPQISLEEGVRLFGMWYTDYHRSKHAASK